MTTPAAEIAAYLKDIDKLYRAGIGCPAAAATEHSYRPALKTLFEKLTTGLTITNEPKHIACGAPDYIITKGGIPLGYIEAKDIPVGIDNKLNKEQFDRYKESLNNLIITDYLSFRLFVDGEAVVTVSIAGESSGGIVPDKKQFDAFLELVNRFTGYSGATIYNSEQLAKMMAGKAKLLAAIIRAALQERDGDGNKVTADSLSGQYEGFKKILMHNLEINEFADMYAQTLAYGLFAARLNQRDTQTFTRYLAPHLIPQSNPFLRNFFNYIAGINLDSRITWIVDALADIFNCVAVEEIIKEFDKSAQDPYIHFYETFLACYDPALREMRGVYYTPVPVVNFIVEAVDAILKTEFGLKNGLADYSKIKRAFQNKDGTSETIEVHKVQILDPATGTGTFLAEVIDKVYSCFSRNKGAWNDYCEKHLISRLNGFEILMASYAMAHLKLDMKLKETGCTRENGQGERLHIYLTNSLDEAPCEVPELFMAQWLAREAEEAGRIKRDTPVMVVLANPPYNVSTQNKNVWIDSLIADYKKDLNEKKLNLDDDYIKFIRYGQYLVEKTGAGILAYISNNSFIDGITHRTMRRTLLEKFDKIYILNLHGNSRMKEISPDGSADGNVFDIMQGTSINIFIKTRRKKDTAIAKVYHSEIFGRREVKYNFLSSNTVSSIKWVEIFPVTPYYFFVPKNFANKDIYEKGFSVTKLFTVYNNGIQTDRDALFIDFEKKLLENRIKTLLSGNYDKQFVDHFNVNDSSSYKLTKLIVGKTFNVKNIVQIHYRPFDYRYIYYQQGLTSRPAYNVMKHMLNDNVSLLSCRQQSSFYFQHAFVSNSLSERCTVSLQTKETTYVFPLYLYPDENSLDKTETRRPNLNMEIVNQIADKTGLRFLEEKEDAENTFSPIDIFDYIYAVLYSGKYRAKYAEFLKIDFPRVPYPAGTEQFQKLSFSGSLLRNLHLMENVSPSIDMASFPFAGENKVDTLNYKNTNVYINKQQYFENIPAEIWAYYIGGYQPAQKWLKDRKGRTLSFDDIEHYQKIITVLKKTIELQQQIDEVFPLEEEM